MIWGAHEVDGRIAARAAVKLRAALRQSIDAKRLFQLYKESDPLVTDNEAQDNARARAWAMMNMLPNNQALINALMYLWAEAFVLGEDSATEAIRQARELKKAPQEGVDWANWKPGDRASALLITPPKAFQSLLSRSGVAIRGLDKTGYDRVGTALARSIRLGLGDTNAAKLINDAIGDPARALTIAITETNRAVSLGAMKTYREAGLEEMEWVTSDPCPECVQNQGQIVQIGGTFNSGAQQPPAHPNCRCALLPVIPDYETNEAGVVDVVPTQLNNAPLAKPTVNGRQDYKYALSEREFDDDYRYAAQRWQGEEYRRIQGALSAGNPTGEIKQTIEILDSNMDYFDDLYEVYRGQTEGLDNLAVGDVFKSPLYQATTTDPITAAGFSKSSGGVLGGVKEGDFATILRIDIESAKGAVIPDSAEYEIVLARNTTFKVNGVSEETINGVKMRIIDVEAKS
jgi:SPP1 gp7 family putative phage head morphogenesis protein